jgi:phytoene synthase
MQILPRPKRDAMFAIYAFCRAVDDIADEPAAVSDKLAGLADWRREIEALYAGHPAHPITRALARPLTRYRLAKDDFIEVVRGMEMDANGPIRAPSMAELELYCDRVAGAVGLLSMSVFECPDPRARDFALATGQALQLTNILRDLAEDAEDGRLYLPRELLDQAGIDGDLPARVLADPAVAQACAGLARVADRQFDNADALYMAMAPGSSASLRPARIMTAVYRRLFERLAARGWERIDEPVRLGKLEKLWIAFRPGILGR